MSHRFDRLEMLTGKEGIKKLNNSNVIIFGIGGVGSYIAESLVRSAIGNITIVDYDEIVESNINRQIHATEKTIGLIKVDVMKERMSNINPNCNILSIKSLLKDNVNTFFENKTYDFAIDAIDTVNSKIELIKYCNINNINLISSMGFANKMNPERIKITDINKTSVCPLAKKIRKSLREIGINELTVAYSDEPPIKLVESNIKNPLGSNAFVPGTAGLIISSYIIRKLLEEL